MSEVPPAKRRRVRITARAILHHEDHVLFLKGHDGDQQYWYVIPGGGVEHGENAEAAVLREVMEETGIEVVVDRLAYVREFIPARHPGRSKFMPATNHVMALIFYCRPCPKIYAGLSAKEIGEFPGDADGTGAVVDMQWIHRKEAEAFDMRPPHLYQAMADGFENEAIGFWPEDATSESIDQ